MSRRPASPRRRFTVFLLVDAVLGCLLAAGFVVVLANQAARPGLPLPGQLAALPSPRPSGTVVALTASPPVGAEQPADADSRPPPTVTALPSTTRVVRSPTPTASPSPSVTASATAAVTRLAPTPMRPETLTPSPPAGVTQPAAASATATRAAPNASASARPSTLTPTRPPILSPTATASATTPPPLPPNGFVGLNGGPLEGNDTRFPYAGNLSHNPPLRAASFRWLARAGVRWYRNYGSDAINLSWRLVEPLPGAFDWAAWDVLVSGAQAHGINLLASIGNSVPAWANGTDNWRQPPGDLYAEPQENTAWYRFVTALVERYDGDGVGDMPGLTQPIKYWEVWNEPDLRQDWNPPNYPAHQFNGNATDYVRLLAVAYTAIKRADPGATVVGPATAQVTGFNYSTTQTMWDWPGFVNAGGLNYVDIVSFHVYFDRTGWDPTGQVDAALNQVDAHRGGKPVWVTEIGWEGNPTSDHADKARNLVRAALIFWARPFMDRFFWYSWQESQTHEGDDHKGLLQSTNGPAAVGVEPDPLFHPAYTALDVMDRVLAGYGPAERPVALDVGGAARAYKFAAGGREVWVAWNRQANGTTTIQLDTGGRTVRVIGLYGEDLGTFAGGSLTLGPNPLYLTTNLNWNPNVGRIAGRVRREALGAVWGNGAAGVTVTLTGPVSAATVTNPDGNYVFEFLPEGTYTVSVAGGGSQQVTVGREAPWGRTSFTVP